MSHLINPAQLEKYLKGISYPASKDELIEQAEENGAPEEVIITLSALEEDYFESPIEVSKAFGHIE